MNQNMTPQDLYQSKKRTLDDFLEIIHPQDSLAISIAAGQPQALLNHLSNKKQIDDLKIFTGLSAFPYPFLSNPHIHTTAGYYGPIERMANEAGFNMAYMPLAFNAFGIYVRHMNPRVVMTTLSPMDEEGCLSFGISPEACYTPFLEAARDPNRLAIAQINPRMPVVQGLPDLGGNKIHIRDLDCVIEAENPLLEIPPAELDEPAKAIAGFVAELIRDGDTLQFGIGSLPNEVARLLTQGNKGNFGIHSELLSDGFLSLMESGKITNEKKGLNDGASIFTFALGSQKLYDWLDERLGKNKGRTLAAPVSYVNDPSVIAKNRNMVGINSGFMIDFSGQVSSEAIGEKQYSGVGGQLNFMQGAFYSEGGRNILCLKSSVLVNGKLLSNIVDSFPSGTIISTPRHFVQYVVTEYGAVNLFGLTDEERPLALIKIAHPNFRDELLEKAQERDRINYKTRRFDAS